MILGGATLGGFAPSAEAQTSPSVNFSSVNVGSSTTATVTVTVLGAGTLGNISVLTQGSPGLDFTNAGGGTCAAGTAYAANATCTVNVTFSPKFAGTRYGAVLLDDGSGNVLATSYVYGTGSGPQVIFAPGTQTNIGRGWIQPQAVAVDGAGNLYVANYPTSAYASGGSVVKETLTGGSYTQSTIGSGIIGPTGMAVDGAGNVYIADSSVEVIFKETPSTGGYVQSQVPTPGMRWPIGVAVDGSGNVYVTDAPNNRVLKETLSGGSYTQSTIGTGLSYPMGIAVDGNGNIYVADDDNYRLVEEIPSSGSYTQSTIASGFAGANGLGDSVAVDGSGNLFIAETSLNQVVMLPWTGNTFAAPVTISNLNNPLGVAVDGGGNVYFTTDSGGFYKLDYAAPPTLSFATTAVGSTSSDSPQTVTVENIGNATLNFPIPSTGNNPSIAANFTLDSSGTAACPLVMENSSMAGTLAAGASCLLPISFKPTAGTIYSCSLVMTDNNLNASAPGYTTQTIILSGTGIGKGTPTVTVTPPSSSITTAQALTVTVGVSGGGCNPTPSGSVTLSSGGYTSAATTLSGGSATINVPAGSLVAGTHTLTANYAPDAASSSTYNNSSNTASVTVTKLTPTVTVTPSSSNITTAQSLTVTVAINGGIGNPTPTGSVILTSGSYTSAATALGGGSATISIPAGSLTAGSDTLTASYSGDANYIADTGTTAVTVTVPPPPSFTVSGSAVTVSPGATSGNTSTITVTPSGGFTGSVALTAALTSSPTGAQYPPTMSFGSTSPVSIIGTTAGMATLTINTTAATSAAVVYPKRPGVPWYATGGATLACLLLIGIPARRRNWRTMLGMLVFLVALTGGVFACGGGGGGGGGGGTSNPGTTAGSYTVTVTGTSGSTTATGTVTLTVQ